MDKDKELKEVLRILRKEPYVTAVKQLKEMGVVLKQSLEAELGEWVAYRIFGGKRLGSSHPVFDLACPNGRNFHIKTFRKEAVESHPWLSGGHKHPDVYVVFVLNDNLGLEKALGGNLKELQEKNIFRTDRKHGPRLYWSMMPELTVEKAVELGAQNPGLLAQWKAL